MESLMEDIGSQLTKNTHHFQIGISPKQWIKGSLVNSISETKSLSKQDLLIKITCSSKDVQSSETILSKLATFPYIHWVDGGFSDLRGTGVWRLIAASSADTVSFLMF